MIFTDAMSDEHEIIYLQIQVSELETGRTSDQALASLSDLIVRARPERRPSPVRGFLAALENFLVQVRSELRFHLESAILISPVKTPRWSN